MRDPAVVETYRAPTSTPDPTLTRQLADLCRTQPAVFARVVRLSDWLQEQGWDGQAARQEALRRADVHGQGGQ